MLLRCIGVMQNIVHTRNTLLTRSVLIHLQMSRMPKLSRAEICKGKYPCSGSLSSPQIWLRLGSQAVSSRNVVPQGIVTDPRFIQLRLCCPSLDADVYCVT